MPSCLSGPFQTVLADGNSHFARLQGTQGMAENQWDVSGLGAGAAVRDRRWMKKALHVEGIGAGWKRELHVEGTGAG